MSKPLILFVDDEKNILKGIRRLLFDKSDEWNLKFVYSAKEALAFIEKTEPNLLVTDIRMPEMDGAQLLEQVTQTHPDMLRIVLSGYTDEEMIRSMTLTAHQFLLKPCPEALLIRTITKLLNLRQFINKPKLQGVIHRIKSVPALPENYLKVINELNSDEPSLDKISAFIREDAGMTSKLLQLVNSAFFGIGTQIASVEEAVRMIGIELLLALFLKTHLLDSVESEVQALIDFQRYRQHLSRVANAAFSLAKKRGSDKKTQDAAYSAGILHDLGKLILALNFPEEFPTDQTADENCESENALFGAGHAEVGAYLLSLWGLPEDIVLAVARHHAPWLPGPDPGDLTLILSLAEKICQTELTLNERERAFYDAAGILESIPKWKEELAAE